MLETSIYFFLQENDCLMLQPKLKDFRKTLPKKTTKRIKHKSFKVFHKDAQMSVTKSCM